MERGGSRRIVLITLRGILQVIGVRRRCRCRVFGILLVSSDRRAGKRVGGCLVARHGP